MNRPLHRLLARLALTLLLIVPSAALVADDEVLLTENFSSYGAPGTVLGAPPAPLPPWVIFPQTNHKWVLRAYGPKTAVANESSSPSKPSLTRSFAAAPADSLRVDFSYDWAAFAASATSSYAQKIICTLKSADGNHGYQLRVSQGNGGQSANDGKLLAVHRIKNGQTETVPFATGGGYNQDGWSSPLAGVAPRFKKIRFVNDVPGRRVFVYIDKGQGYEESIGHVDDQPPQLAHAKLEFAVEGMASALSKPIITDIQLVKLERFHWGVNGHAADPTSAAYWSTVPVNAAGSTVSQLGLTNELGCNYYRVGVRDGAEAAARFQQVVDAANSRTPKINILPIIYKTNGALDNSNLDQIYQLCYDKAYAWALAYKNSPVITHVELENELDNACILSSAYSGVAASDYDADRYSRARAVLKGLSDGVGAGAPGMKRIINAGWYHYGFIDMLRTASSYSSSKPGFNNPVAFEALGWHWYSSMWSMSRVMKKLSSYNLPIWVTEFNRTDGSYKSTSILTDELGSGALGSYPAGWTRGGEWKIQEFGPVGDTVIGCANMDGTSTPAGRTLTKSFATAGSPLTGNWEVKFDYDWKHGGFPEVQKGSKDLILECDVVNDINQGYRVSIRQGDSDNSTYTDTLIRIFRINGASTELLKSATGHNKNGFGNLKPKMKNIRFQRDKSSYYPNSLSVVYDPEGDEKQAAVNVDDSTYNSFTKIIFRTREYNSPVTPLINKVSLRKIESDWQAQSDLVAKMTSEIRNFPGVKALFAYELLDEFDRRYFNPEGHYGLCYINGGPGNRSYGGKKTAFDTYKDEINLQGTIPVPPDGPIVVDDAYQSPATAYTPEVVPANPTPPTSAVWRSDSLLSGSYFTGYVHDGNTNRSAGNTVRFYAHIPVSGNYAVSMRYPVGTSNSTNTGVVVKHSGGTTSKTVNQQEGGGEWQPLGTFNFNAWQPGIPGPGNAWELDTNAAYVQITNGSATGCVIADAVRFTKVVP